MKSSGPETILIVDDQQENIRIVGSVLSEQRYDIVAATSAEQAFRRLQARLPDIILLDVLMPGMDGLATCRKIKENPVLSEIPIIFLSASDEKSLVVQALEAGGVDYVTKPFNTAELLTRVRTHLSLKQASDRLKQLAKDKDEILGILAHDLKNGIAGMQLSAELLAERADDLPPRSGSLAKNLAETSAHLLAHLNYFLANQRAEQLTVTCESLVLEDVLQQVMTRNQAAADRKSIQLEISRQPQPTLVSADAEALIQVFDNLVSNSIKFMPEGGRALIEINSPISDHVSCHLHDSGPGFSDDDRQHLFRRYQRLSARPTANEPSSGLGLSIAKRLIGLMSGSLELASEKSRLGGAEFIVTLPLAPTPA